MRIISLLLLAALTALLNGCVSPTVLTPTTSVVERPTGTPVLSAPLPVADSVVTLKYVRTGNSVLYTSTVPPQYPAVQNFTWSWVACVYRSGAFVSIDTSIIKPFLMLGAEPRTGVDSLLQLYPFEARVNGDNRISAVYGMDSVRLRLARTGGITARGAACTPYCHELDRVLYDLVPRCSSYRRERDTLWIDIR